MRTMGIQPGDAVLLIEHRGDQQIVYNALVKGISMRRDWAGTHGEPAIRAEFIGPLASVFQTDESKRVIESEFETVTVASVVHISHHDWIERRASLGYEELPGPVSGMCRYCRCTQNRACVGGCGWLDAAQTVCSSDQCHERWVRDNMLRTMDAGSVTGGGATG